MTTEDEAPTKLVSMGTPEEIAAARAKAAAEMDYHINEGPNAPRIQEAAETLSHFENQTPEDSAEILRAHAVDLLNNIEAFKRGQVSTLIPMLSTQATVLNSLFNRSLRNAGLEDKEKFCVHKANVALQAQRQCRTLLEFMSKNWDT